jgi:preprotein translocase subunit SecD
MRLLKSPIVDRSNAFYVDANVTHILIVVYLGSGPIKGFATTY